MYKHKPLSLYLQLQLQLAIVGIITRHVLTIETHYRNSSVGKHYQVWGAQKLNRVDLYGNNIIPIEKEGPWPLGSYAYEKPT